MIEMSPAAVVTEVTSMDTSACCSVEDTCCVFQCTIVMVKMVMDGFPTRIIIKLSITYDICKVNCTIVVLEA